MMSKTIYAAAVIPTLARLGWQPEFVARGIKLRRGRVLRFLPYLDPAGVIVDATVVRAMIDEARRND